MAGDPVGRSPRSPSYVGWFLSTLGLVVLLQVGYALLILTLWPVQMEVRGQFGDLFGAVTALFTGLAFAGVIYTIILQREELRLQRQELSLTRAELERSADAQTEQVSQLQEAANLNASRALLNVYSTDLQPLRDIKRDPLRQLADTRASLSRVEDMHPSRRSDLERQVSELEQHIVDQEAEWSTLLRKHDALVTELDPR